MTITTCDICGCRINSINIKVTFKDGEHPHNGSTCYTTKDCCYDCATKIPDLQCDKEFEDVVKAVMTKKI